MITHTTHSPAPWRDQGDGFILDADQLVVAEVLSENPIDGALVIAAPDLLAALKALYALTPDCDGDYLLDGNKGEFATKAIRVPGIGEACMKARAAIARAEGR